MAPAFHLRADETLWDHGDPTRVDMLNLLRHAAAHSEGPPNTIVGGTRLSVSYMTELAMDRFGKTSRLRVEAVFDQLVRELGGRRGEDATDYVLPSYALNG